MIAKYEIENGSDVQVHKMQILPSSQQSKSQWNRTFQDLGKNCETDWDVVGKKKI